MRKVKPTVRLVGVRSIGPDGLPIPARNFNHSQVFRSLFTIMDSTELCSLSTVTPRGTAHSAHVYFAYSSSLELYFLTDPNSVHCTNLRTKPSMAVSIYDSTQQWGKGSGDKGVALYGRCRMTRGIETRAAEEAYGGRFREYAAWRVGPGYDEMAEKWRFYKFTSSRIKVFDEPRFGRAVFITASVRPRQ